MNLVLDWAMVHFQVCFGTESGRKWFGIGFVFCACELQLVVIQLVWLAVLGMSTYDLMHKNIAVCQCRMEDGWFDGIVRLVTPEHMPVGCSDGFGNISSREAERWWMSRLIPSQRINQRHIVKALSGHSFSALSLNSFGC